MLGSI